MGALLVALQFGLIVLLLAAVGQRLSGGRLPLAEPTGWPALVLMALAVALGALALWANRPGNFRIGPAPKAGAQLVTHGVYSSIHHPMYTSLLLFCGGCAWVLFSPGAWLLWGALWLVLALKAHLEERALCERHPDYRDYQRRTWRWLPGVF